MATQLIMPDLNAVGNIGWCLAFVEKAYGTTRYDYAYAVAGWKAAYWPHADRNFPANVYIPIWFNYTENGFNYGHVAILETSTGRVLSSPYAKENTHVWFTSIAQCETVLNCQYLGWSEDMMGTKVIDIGDSMSVDKLNKDEVNQIITAFHGVGANDNDYNVYVGQPLDSLLAFVTTSPQRRAYLKSVESNQSDADKKLAQIQSILKG